MTPLFANGIHIVEDSFLKPINVLTEGLLFFADDTISELKSIQKIVTPSTMLNQEDLKHIKNWLLDHELDEGKVNQLVQRGSGNPRTYHHRCRLARGRNKRNAFIGHKL